MRTITINIYTFDELSESAKKRAAKDYYNTNICMFAEDFADAIQNDIERLFPRSTLFVQWDFGGCQGDGVNIFGELDLRDIFGDKYTRGKTEEENNQVTNFLNECLKITLSENQRYTYSMKFVDKKTPLYDLTNYEPTTQAEAEAIEHAILFALDILEEREQEIKDEGENFFDVKNQINYIADLCAANDYYFLEDGEFYK